MIWLAAGGGKRFVSSGFALNVAVSSAIVRAGGTCLTMCGVLAQISRRRWVGYLASVFGILAATGALKLFGERINATTVALALLLVVLLIATGWGSRPGVVASLL